MPSLVCSCTPFALARLLPYQAAAMASTGAFSASDKGKSEGGKMPGDGKVMWGHAGASNWIREFAIPRKFALTSAN